MKINTGRGTIPLITLVGIWSVSALTSLPGLAVSPILGQLTTIFPHATELDIQMLTSLPSLLIIPFVLLAGKLAEKRDFVRLLKAGLWMFAASGVLYLFSDKMWQLMVVSALLGIGSGGDYSVVHRSGFTLFHGGISGEAVWLQFCHHQCDAGCGNGGDWVSGRGKLALAFRGIPASVGFSAACRIFEGGYRSAADSRRYSCRCSGGIQACGSR